MGRKLKKIHFVCDQSNQSFISDRRADVDLLVAEDLDFALKIGANGLCLSDFSIDVEGIRKKHPNLIIGGLATTVADCKNWELLQVDFIHLTTANQNNLNGGLHPILGSEVVQNLISKEENYGWMIMSLNTPVFVAGLSALNELNELVKNASVYGIVLTPQFESNQNLSTKINKILEILD